MQLLYAAAAALLPPVQLNDTLGLVAERWLGD